MISHPIQIVREISEQIGHTAEVLQITHDQKQDQKSPSKKGKEAVGTRMHPLNIA